MASCTGRELGFSRLKRRALEVNFGGGDVSSDGGLLLVREVDRRLQLTQRAAAVLHDPRDPDLITHPLRDLIRQRVDAIVQGYEDLNDHAELRQDVFCGEQLLVSYLRPSKIDAAKPAWAILALLVKRLRQAGPEGRLIVCAGTGFCGRRMLAWCERHGVGYCVGLAKNERLNAATAVHRDELARRFAASGVKQRAFHEFAYAAATWHTERRVIARLEHADKGDNPRYIVTHLSRDAATLYDELYCARGEAQNRIKEAQLGLFSNCSAAPPSPCVPRNAPCSAVPSTLTNNGGNGAVSPAMTEMLKN